MQIKSKYKYYWNFPVKLFLNNVSRWINDGSMQSQLLQYAFYRTLEDIKTLADGNEILQAVNMVLINKTHSQDGAALALHISRATVQRRLYTFIDLFAYHAGYIKSGE